MSGKDYVYPGEPAHLCRTSPNPMTGVGPFTHASRPTATRAVSRRHGDRPHRAATRLSYLLLPVVPAAG